MLTAKTHEIKMHDYPECIGMDKKKRKIKDFRRRSRRAPASHPWRQYKATQYKAK